MAVWFLVAIGLAAVCLLLFLLALLVTNPTRSAVQRAQAELDVRQVENDWRVREARAQMRSNVSMVQRQLDRDLANDIG